MKTISHNDKKDNILLEKMPNEMADLIKKLRKKENDVVIYGASDAGKNYASILQSYSISIICFIDDDPKKQNEIYYGIKVFSVQKFVEEYRTGNEIILVASYSPSIIIHKLREQYPFLYKQVEWSDFYLWENELDYFQYYQENMSLIENVFGLLYDEKSRHVFRNLLNYKISRNHKWIEEIQDDVNEQYYTSEIMKFSDSEVYVDLGAYSGDTICEFYKVVKGMYKKIIAVEPDRLNFQKLVKNTSMYSKIDYYPVGISDKDGSAKFKEQALYTSHFDEDGEIEIETKSVDNIMMGKKATFIKADIEGLETKMLMGARYTIEKYKPKIAIAVYHKKEDIFNIPLLLYSYRRDYRFFLRHYTEMPIDTVLYAI